MLDVIHSHLTTHAKRCTGLLVTTGIVCFLVSCVSVPRQAPGIWQPIPWTELPGWREDQLAQAWPAFMSSCQRLASRAGRWRDLCADAALFSDPDNEIARAFFETRFVPHKVVGDAGATDGLITGYYEPLLSGSLVHTERFRYPLYRRPDDLLIIDLGDLYPELQGKRYRGRLQGSRVVPYYSRDEITGPLERKQKSLTDALSGQEIAWVDDPVAVFFLEVQGSGRVQLPDGRMLRVGYADQNGHPYVAIGRTLVESGALTLEEATLPGIRAWLAAHPDEARKVLNSNPSYVFFTVREGDAPGPVGALNVPLWPERSIAVDPAFIPLGSPVWLDTTLPDDKLPVIYRRLEFALDTGGAIRGPTRADLFFGFGEQAERLAGTMRQRGKMYVLLPAARNL